LHAIFPAATYTVFGVGPGILHATSRPHSYLCRTTTTTTTPPSRALVAAVDRPGLPACLPATTARNDRRILAAQCLEKRKNIGEFLQIDDPRFPAVKGRRIFLKMFLQEQI
jgi:hypothetical protein